jgi:hypothetical protein
MEDLPDALPCDALFCSYRGKRCARENGARNPNLPLAPRDLRDWITRKMISLES